MTEAVTACWHRRSHRGTRRHWEVGLHEHLQRGSDVTAEDREGKALLPTGSCCRGCAGEGVGQAQRQCWGLGVCHSEEGDRRGHKLEKCKVLSSAPVQH